MLSGSAVNVSPGIDTIDGVAETISFNENTQDILTFVMVVEYNGFQYAGFQRQTATPRDGTADGDNATAAEAWDVNCVPSCLSPLPDSHISNQKRLHSQRSNAPSQQHLPNKKAKKNKSITVQDQIETALQSWTNLTISTLRVRSAGRTDKGVHASGQVVAFDVPLNLIQVDQIDDKSASAIDKQKVGSLRDGYTTHYREALSDQSIQHLYEAYRALTAHRSKTNNGDGDNTESFIDHWQMRRAIATRLPADIVLRSLRMWAGSHPFEPRKGISRKTYIYKLRFRSLTYLDEGAQSSSTAEDGSRHLRLHPICNAGPHLLRRVDDQNTVWLCHWPLEPTLLREASVAFVGRHDFVNFVHKEERYRANKCFENNSNRRDVAQAAASPHEIDLLQFEVDMQSAEESCLTLPPVVDATFTLKAKGFHRSMVRNIIGYVVDVGRGVRHVDDIPMLLLKTDAKKSHTGCSEGKSLASMVNSAPACGLCLYCVEYEHDHFLRSNRNGTQN